MRRIIFSLIGDLCLLLAVLLTIYNVAQLQKQNEELRNRLRPIVCSVIIHEDGSASFADAEDAYRAECISQKLRP